ncbi:MAG: hypothetical protein WA989_17295, partial [Henriciella sp.]|uniref:tetratricopeptide repeat protein n=1 Tax=Henriciella sp. TaxID=1968823 RepID=UPI003C73BCDA
SEAASALDASFNELPANDSWLTTPPAGQTEAQRDAWVSERAGFRLGRATESAVAYRGLASRYEAGANLPSASICSDRMDCLSKALNRLSGARGALSAFAATATEPPRPEYDNYYLQLARLHAARATPADSEPAISAYQEIMARQPAARSELAALTTELGSDAATRDDAGSATLAIRYFDIARQADASAFRPEIGLGNVYLRLGQAGGDIVQYQAAEEAFTRALSKASSRSDEAAAYVGRGSARDAIASLQGTSREAALADFKEASDRASSGDVYLVLANAYRDQGNWEQADTDYTRAITALRSEGASGATLAKAYMDQAHVRSQIGTAPANIRALYSQAVSAQPNSAKPLMARAKFDIAHGDWAAAEADLLRVASATSRGSLDDAIAHKPEANSLLADLYASKPSPDYATAVRFADEAVRLDGTNPEYRAEACLARILRGRDGVWGDGAEAACNLGTDTDELLVRSMFAMRRAQYASVANANRIRRDARDDADDALDGAGSGVTGLDWPTRTSPPPTRTKAILLYIQEAALACGGNYTFDLPTDEGVSSQEYAQASAFLDAYNSRKCTP